MFIKSEKYSVLQAACGIPVYFTKLKPVEEKIADITTAARSNRTSSIQAVAVNEIMSTGQSILIKPIAGQIDGLNNIDTSFIGTYKITSIEYINSAANITYYQNLSDIISTNIAAEIYSIPNIDPSDSYLVEFFTESVVPSTAEAIIRPARYVVAGNESFTPTTTIELRSKFSTSAKALVKMVIKNALTNKVLRNEYIEIVMSDSDTKPCEIITEKPIENTFIDLNKDNEWTYNYQGYTLAQFIPYNKNILTSIQLIKKNNQLLPNRGDQNRFKVVVDPIKLANKKVTIEQIRNAVLQQFNTIQNYSVIANTVNKSYDIIFKDVLLQPQDLNDLVIAVVPPVTGTPVKLSDVADATNDGVISDRSEIPGISLLRWNENYIGELHFDRNIYLNDIINVKYNTYNLSGIITDFYLGLNSLKSLPLPTPTNTPSSTPTSTATPTATAPIIPDNIYACDFWENYFNGLYSLSYTDENGKGVYIHDILDMNDEDTGVNTILSYDNSITGWILSYCGLEEVAENCFAANFKSSSQVSPFGPWIRLSSAPQHYTAGSIGVNVCEGMPTSTPTQTAMQQAPTPTPTITPTVNELLPPTGFNIVCGECTGEGNPQNATVDLSWSYQIDPMPQGAEIHAINYNSEIIDIKLVQYPIASTGISLPLSNDLTLFRIRSFGNQQYSSWNFFPYAFNNSICCSPTATPTPTPTSTSALPTSTPVPPTPTPTSTSTPVPPTATPTSTQVPPTATPTSTAAPPTATPTSTATPTPTPTSMQSVQYISSSLEQYGCSTTNTVSNTIPASTQSGDLIIALLMRRSSITNSSSFSLLDEIATPGTSTGQYTSVYTKVANNTDANSNLTFTQASNGRMGLAIIVLRSSNNTFNIENLSKNSSSTDIPLLPSVTSNGGGRIAISMLTNTFSNIGFPPCDLPNYIYTPSGYQATTNTSLCSYADSESSPQCQQLRMGVAYKVVNTSGNIHQNSETFTTNVTDRRIGQVSFIVSPS